MENAIKTFAEQFKWEGQIVNQDKLGHEVSKWIVCGLGGSHLAAGLLKLAEPTLDLLIHRDYGLPRVPDYFLTESLIVLSSYSGNTEEVLDAGAQALARGLNLAVVTKGGKLLAWAQANNLPHIQLPQAELEPRMALGYSLKALAKLIGQVVPDQLALADQEAAGQELATKIKGKIPLIYSSTLNLPIAYNWKIKFNETTKIPAFYNVVPELNHNEMTGFEGQWARREWNDKFMALFITDSASDPRINKRFQVLTNMYRERGVVVEELPLSGASLWERIFNSLTLADWTTYHLAKLNGDDPNGATPMITEFKNQVASN